MFYRFAADLKKMLASGLTLEDSIAQLRSKGASAIECIAAIKDVRDCDLAEAKFLVHTSRAWRDVAEATERMWAELDREDPGEKKA